MNRDSKIHEIQDQYCSSYDKRKQCSYDVEFIDGPTKPLIHQTSRFWLFLKGSGVLLVDDRTYEIKENTFVAIMPWETTAISQVSEPLLFIKIVYNNSFLEDARFNYNISQQYLSILEPITANPVIYLTDEEQRRVKSIMDDIKQEVGTDSLFDKPEEKALSNIYVNNKLMELLIVYNRYLSKLQLKNMDGKDVELDNRSSIFKYMYAHISGGISLTTLSEVFYLSESTISRYIQNVTGMTFTDVLREMRINKAHDLLANTDLSVNDIASLVGFSDSSHFIKAFNSRMEISPSQYRRNYQNNIELFHEKNKSYGFELISYINSHYTDDLKIGDVAEKFNTNEVDINKTLLYLTEKNFDNLLTYLRINKACELLLSSDDSILDVAVAVGYNNPKTFTRNFEKLKYTSPGEFRRHYQLQVGSESIPQDRT